MALYVRVFRFGLQTTRWTGPIFRCRIPSECRSEFGSPAAKALKRAENVSRRQLSSLISTTISCIQNAYAHLIFSLIRR